MVDGVVVRCWNVTYLFRLGFERWISARPGYDAWVMLGVVVAYLWPSWLVKVPQEHVALLGLRRGQAPDLRLRAAPACVRGRGDRRAGLNGVPRAVLALHPVVALMGAGDGAHRLPHALRARAARASPAATPRSGARSCWAPARRPACCWPASTTRAGSCSACSTTTRQARRAHRRRAGAGAAERGAGQGRAAARHAPHRRDAVGARRATPRGARARRRRRPAGADRAVGRRAARRQRSASSGCATSSPKTCSAASRCSSTRPASPRRCAARRC